MAKVKKEESWVLEIYTETFKEVLVKEPATVKIPTLYYVWNRCIEDATFLELFPTFGIFRFYALYVARERAVEIFQSILNLTKCNQSISESRLLDLGDVDAKTYVKAICSCAGILRTPSGN